MGFYYFRDTSPLLNGGEQDGNKQKKMIDRWTGQAESLVFVQFFFFFFFSLDLLKLLYSIVINYYYYLANTV